MIFVSGIHGVGKSYFCEMIKNRLGINSYSASQLITIRRNQGFSTDKLVPDINDNQSLLVAAINELRITERKFILDGHFCLLNSKGDITRIPADTYSALRPDRLILLTEKPEVILERRFKRDGIEADIMEIEAFQNAEKKYAEEIAEQLGIPLIVSDGAEDLERVIKLIGSGEN